MRLESPESMTVCFTSISLREAIASRESSFTASATTMCPRYLPSTATWTLVPATSSWQNSIPWSSISLWLPTMISDPSMTARTPLPATSSAEETRYGSAASAPALCMDLDMGWFDTASAAAAIPIRRSESSSMEWTFEISKLPLVRVPVLSNTTAWILDMASM